MNRSMDLLLESQPAKSRVSINKYIMQWEYNIFSDML